eukprot:2223952-Amphidinium_carterae.1
MLFCAKTLKEASSPGPSGYSVEMLLQERPFFLEKGFVNELCEQNIKSTVGNSQLELLLSKLQSPSADATRRKNWPNQLLRLQE